jgi:NAD(P)-dependent dehydrogenase (short-subunit alcohol dehydrogenase family)
MDRLRGKVAIVTGATTGIGQGIAQLFAEEGAQVVVVGRSKERGQETLELITSAGGEAVFVPADVSLAAEARNMVAQTVDHFGRLDILVSNAAIFPIRKNVIDTSEEEWDWIVDVNLKGTFLSCKYTIPAMLESGGGSILTVSSVSGLVGTPLMPAYLATKGGIIAMTRGIAVDHAPHIRANVICPGSVESAGSQALIKDRETWEVAVSTRTLMGRPGQPQDVAYAALYMVSDEASWVTAAVLSVDGGLYGGRNFRYIE